MTAVPLPPYTISELAKPAALINSIVSCDQFDDWIPDPVYYKDMVLDKDAAVERFEGLWNAGAQGAFRIPQLQRTHIPRRNGSTVAAIALPWDVRLCAYRVIEAIAPKINKRVNRDKVYGFEYDRNGQCIFTVFGEKVSEAVENTVANLVRNPAVTTVMVWDPRRFLANTRFDVFSKTLSKLGVRPAELAVLRAILPATGLLASDDAFGFLYNFYLQPVDEALEAARMLFVRYGDDYFLFTREAAAIAQRAGHSLGLDIALKQTLEKSQFPDERSLPGWVDKLHAYGSRVKDFEGKFESYWRDDVVNAPGLWDGYVVLPLYREIHRNRSIGAMLMPPYSAAPKAFDEYRAVLNRYRGRLVKALTTGIAGRSAWQISWAVAALSDLDDLRPAELAAIRDVLQIPGLDHARLCARVALARTDKVMAPEKLWNPADLRGFEHDARGAVLLASYLARRGWTRAWQQVQASGQHRTLVNFLREYTG